MRERLCDKLVTRKKVELVSNVTPRRDIDLLVLWIWGHKSLIMRRKNNSNTKSVYFFEKFDDAFCVIEIETCCGLISEDNIWFMNKRSSNGHSLRFTSREMFWIRVCFVKHRNFCEYLMDSRVDTRGRISTYLHSISDIFCDCFRRDELVILKNHTTCSSVRTKILRGKHVDVTTTMIDKRATEGSWKAKNCLK